MTITLPTTARRRADRASRRTTAAQPVTSRVPTPRESEENPGARAPRTVVAAEDRRRIARTTARDDEMAAQGLAFAAESAHLRERAALDLSIVEQGGRPDLARIDEVLRAFRSYAPFLSARDRALNDVVRRRLVAAVGPARERRAG